VWRETRLWEMHELTTKPPGRRRSGICGESRSVFLGSLVVVTSCGGRVALEETPPETMLDGSEVGSITLDGGEVDGARVAADANTVPYNGSNSSSDGGTPIPDACPTTCTGGCTNGVCTVDCAQSPWACESTSIICPPGRACTVTCNALSACQITSIICPSDAPCEVLCNATSACEGMTIQCPMSAPCTVGCGGTSACQGGTMTCGQGPCATTCTGLSAQLSVVGCGKSSSCHNGC
jgi:hypothetical protein